MTALLLAGGLAAAGCATSDSSAALDRGVAHYRAEELFFAAADFSEAIKQNPRSVQAYVNRGITRVRLGDVDGALADYARALELAATDPDIYFDRGNALISAGRYEPAVEDFSRAIELSPEFVRAWFNRGTARWLAGQSAAATQDWRHAIEIETDPEARAAMRRNAVLQAAPAVSPIPPAVRAAPATATSPVVARPAPPAAVTPTSPGNAEARGLASRAITRELGGDHEGALADLRTALTLEPDPVRREQLQGLLRLLEAPQ